MKCIVCGKEETKDLSSCTVCGFPFVRMTRRDENSLRKLRAVAQRYRKESLAAMDLLLRIFVYKRSEEGLTFASERKMPLLSYRELSAEGIRWIPGRFARTSGPLALRVVIASNDRETTVKVPMEAPAAEDDWMIGVSLVREGVVRLHVGSPSKYSESREIELFLGPGPERRTEIHEQV